LQNFYKVKSHGGNFDNVSGTCYQETAIRKKIELQEAMTQTSCASTTLNKSVAIPGSATNLTMISCSK
jgi:hypothetical protein